MMFSFYRPSWDARFGHVLLSFSRIPNVLGFLISSEETKNNSVNTLANLFWFHRHYIEGRLYKLAKFDGMSRENPILLKSIKNHVKRYSGSDQYFRRQIVNLTEPEDCFTLCIVIVTRVEDWE